MTTPVPTPASTTHLVLARHAVTAETGSVLSGRAPGHHQSAVYASPIERTTQTAEAVARHHSLAVRPLPGVIEADYGEWTGQKLTDLAGTDLWKVVQRTPSRMTFPGGEAMAAMQSRMVDALEAVVADHPGELVVVVSHADPIKAAIAHYTGVHLDLFQRIAVSPASVTAFSFGHHGVTMLKCNDTGGLADLAPPAPAPTTDATDAIGATDPSGGGSGGDA
jgi:probable phosphoglycerate mutase